MPNLRLNSKRRTLARTAQREMKWYFKGVKRG